ncbi:amidohydrolase [Bacillus methanolicus PB1]|uniref:Amidohydrolase n=1 Tax=Bacillus methanolicus PB1 TaxID=997296 RepID=I3E1Q4_BACMT|nr:amidohydrolase family protein [Bacillus methanolicus]EIJ80425.1 amidohydrolase [Bacillus methanolicus PB1]
MDTVHLINVFLPLYDSNQLFEIIIKNGSYELIRKQSSYLEMKNVIKLDGLSLSPPPTSLKTIDCQGSVLLPSFIDAHMHLDKACSLNKVANHSGTLEEAILNYRQQSPFFSVEEIEYRAIKTALNALSHGTAAIRTHVNFEVALGEDVVFRALEAVLRAREKLKPYIDIQIFPMFSWPDDSSKRKLEWIEEAINMGVDGIGGAPHLAVDPEKEIDFLFDLAEKHDKPIDLHADESDDPNVCTLDYIIQKTVEHQFQNRVVVGHLCSLAPMEHEKALLLIDRMAEAEIGAVTLPGANMYLQGRFDSGIVRRGVTRINEILQRGVTLAAASDNVNDPFHPFGKADLLQIGLLTAYAAHLGSNAGQKQVIKMITEEPAKLLHINNHGVQQGSKASFVILRAGSIEEIFTNLPSERYVFHKGRWIYHSKIVEDWGDSVLAFYWNSIQKQHELFEKRNVRYV